MSNAQPGEVLIKTTFSSEVEQKQTARWDFPGGPAVKTLPSNAGGEGSIPGGGAQIPHASWPKKPRHKTEVKLQQIQ